MTTRPVSTTEHFVIVHEGACDLGVTKFYDEQEALAQHDECQLRNPGGYTLKRGTDMSEYENVKEVCTSIDALAEEVAELRCLLRDAFDGYERGENFLRDRFAMAALQGMLAGRPHLNDEIYPIERLAEAAYELADAMLTQREVE